MGKSSAQVMLVDDNPIILDILQRGLEPLAQTVGFTDPDAALEQCFQAPPDLVICDYRMPHLDGGQFVQKLKTRPETSHVRVILVAAKADIEERLRPFSDLVEEFASKPFYIRELSARAKKVLDRIQREKAQKQGETQGVIRGRLAEMNLIDLFQSLELGQKTCALMVERESEQCRMYFSGGQLLHAELGPVEGDEAVYQVAGWTDGSFQIDFTARSDKTTTTRSTQSLLMEALRLLDERHKDEGNKEGGSPAG